MTDIHRVHIPEVVVPGKRLGRHVEHDPRSLLPEYLAPEAPKIISTVHTAKGLPLDQGDVGSCTAEALVGAINSTPDLPPSHNPFPQRVALDLYKEELREEGHPWPEDYGGTGVAVCKAAKHKGLIHSYATAVGVTHALKSLVLRPVITGINWYECIPDGQRVLTSDLRWVPIEKVQVGDELIGFDESIGMHARMRRTSVIDMGTKHRPVVEVSTPQGCVSVSSGHLFVRCDPKQGQSWVRADELEPGDRLAYFMEPYDADNSWEAGWLSGFFDGEGTCAGDYQVNFAQAVGPTLDRARELLIGKGFEANAKQKRYPGIDDRGVVSTKEVHNVYVTGPYHGALRFLGQVRPARLLGDCAQLWEGRATKSRRCPPVEVLSVKSVGVEPVHSIGTSTGTLVVEGFLSHNSFDTPSSAGLVKISGQVRGGHEVVVEEIDVPHKLVWLYNSWGLSYGKKGRFCMSWSTWDRLLHEQGDVTVPLV